MSGNTTESASADTRTVYVYFFTHQVLKTAPLGLMVMNLLQQKIQVLLVLLGISATFGKNNNHVTSNDHQLYQ